MKVLFLQLCTFLLFMFGSLCVNAVPPVSGTVSTNLSMPLLFTENRGQVADAQHKPRPDILFTAHSGNVSLFLTATSIYYQFVQTKEPGRDAGIAEQAEGRLLRPFNVTSCRFSVTLAHANPQPVVRREEKNIAVENFYLPQCPQGITGVSTYTRLVYENVYPGIDWIIYSNGRSLKYDFLVHPGGDPTQIKLKITDADEVSISGSGELIMKTKLGEIKEKAPISHVDGEQVKSSFKKNKDGTIGFDVSAEPGKTLRIDPAVLWSTYFGGGGSEAVFSPVANGMIMGLAKDNTGNIYMTGSASLTSANLATPGAYQLNGNVFIARFSPAGVLLYATYYGGTGAQYTQNCAADAFGNVYVAGTTQSNTGISTPGSFQQYIGVGAVASTDAYLAKFNSAGIRIWGTYYGSGEQETNACCAVDPAGNVYLCGITNSLNGPLATPGAYQLLPSVSSTLNEGFLAKFDAAGNRLWGTYYGGTGAERSLHCAADDLGNIYLTGSTTSTAGISSPGAYQPSFAGSSDNFLVKFTGTGARVWATYYGGAAADFPFSCASDGSNNVYISGITSSTSGVATPGSYQSAYGLGGYDNFLVKFNPSGAPVWGTYYGGTGTENFGFCGTDNFKNVFLAGTTISSSGIAYLGFQNMSTATDDAYLVKFDSAGVRLWGSYFGGTGDEAALNCLSDQQGSVYVTGTTSSAAGIATPGSYQPAYAGATDAFLVKIADITIITDTTIAGSPFCAGATVNVPFYLEGTFAFLAGNVFTAQLSDATGSFASPVAIGTLSGFTAGTIVCAIPVGTPSGTGYRIRVVSSSPVVTGSNNKINLTINASATPVVSITASPAGAVCAGTSVTFTAVPVNGGAAPSFQWKKNGINTGTNSASYTDNTLSNGDVISVVLTSNAACLITPTATSNTIAMVVNPLITPSVTIAVNPGNTICAGTSVTFTATPVNGGVAPAYQWKKNSVNVGTNSNTYTDNALNSADVITVVLTSNAACLAAPTAIGNSITMTVNPVITPAVTIASNPNSPICAGTSVTFTAMPVNGGATPSYQWKKNGVNVGTNSATYSDNGLINNDVITVVMTNNAGCLSTPTVTSNGITVTVNAILTPSISIAANPGSPICAGTPVTFTAVPVNGGTTPSYQWKKNSVNTGTNNPVYTDAGLANGDIVTVAMTSNAVCVSTTTANGNNIVISVNPVTTPAVTIAVNPGAIICAGTTVTFTATQTNGGSNPLYQWKVNGINTGANSNVFTSSTLTNADVVSCVLTSSAPCNSAPAATSSGIVMTVNPITLPTATITANPGNYICSGIPVTFTATTANGGANPTYQWKKNGVNVGTNSITYTSNALANGDVVTFDLASNAACAIPSSVASAPVVMVVSTSTTPSISITATPGNVICSGTVVTFTAVGLNGGAAPVYQWKKNGVSVGANSTTYTDPLLTSGDLITATLISNAACITTNQANSNSIAMTITPSVVPGINVNATTPWQICAGASVTFYTNITGGGTNPQYQWMKNASTVGSNAPTYTTASLANGDTIRCILTSNANCPTLPTVSSNKLGMQVSAVVTPTAIINAISGTNLNIGQWVTFTATITNGGSQPLYQWYVNGQAIPGETNATFVTNTLQAGDEVTVKLTSSAPCAFPFIVNSNKLSIKPSTGVTDISSGDMSLTLSPNPNNGLFNLSGEWNQIPTGRNIKLQILNMLGQVVCDQTLQTPNEKQWNITVKLNNDTSNGLYILRLEVDDRVMVKRFELTR